ncbi:MAG: M28 family peptidase [Lentisphaerae bacterium]|nr:M28 family peptidase [Lentisphaerota bacterium]
MAILFLLLGWGVLALFVEVSQPRERQPRAMVRPTYSEAPLEQALARYGFETRLGEIAAAGSRVTGTPGCEQVATLVSNAFQRAGLEVLTQEFEVTIPVTEVCEIRDAATGQPLDGVRVYPFIPAGLMPISCTITTRLVAAETAALRWLDGHDPREVTVVTTVSGGATWTDLAAAGAPALIVRTDPDQQALFASPDQPENWNALVTGWEHPFPIFNATGPIASCTGRVVVLNCRVAWRPRPAHNVLGVLRGRNAHGEALVVSAYMDSSSVVPDLAPGAEQAIPLAALLDLMQALAPYRNELSRDVIFVATAGHAQGLAGVSRLMEAIETFSATRPDHRTFEARRAEHQAAERAVPDDPLLLRTAAGEVHLQRREATLAARLDYLRAGSPVYRDGFDAARATDAERKAPANRHPLLDAYLRAKEADNEASDLVSAPAASLLARPDYGAEIERLRAEAAAWHATRIRHLDDLIRVRDLFAAYRKTLTLNLDLTSGGSEQCGTLSLLVGEATVGPVVEPQVTDLANLLMLKTPGLHVRSWGAADAAGSPEYPNRNSSDLTELESEAWFHCGRLAFSLCNHEFLPGKLGTPEDRLADLNLTALRTQVPAAGRLALALAGGQVDFKVLPANRSKKVFALHGTVYGDAGTATMVPSHPMGRDTVVRAAAADGYRRAGTLLAARGISIYPPVTTSPYGTYDCPIVFNFDLWSRMTVDAARFDAAGRLAFYRDAGAAIASVYPSANLTADAMQATAGRDLQPVNVGLFRCSPVALYPCVNPQTQQPFKGVSFLTREGLTGPAHFNQGQFTAFLEPDLSFHVSLLDGAADNPEILTPRAFLLNVAAAAPAPSDNEPELAGRGYLAADTPVLAWPQLAAAESMLRTAEKRLRLQRRYHMADDQMLGFHARGTELLRQARAHLAAGEPLAAANAGAASLAYAMANHPVIRGRISQAVVGILWYLGLLVPFVFFAEKLLFGFPDIRKQLVAMTIIFLIVFGLLQAFHPAFQMVRSSLMILLGFVILLLTLLVTAMVGGKFRQNLMDLRRREGRVEGADVNRGGVVGTAFMLGLNNMRRRKVRTGLTCVTLVLITFVMICFTSVSTDLVDVEYPTGHSPWNGIMVRNENYVTISPAQVSTVQQLYGATLPVSTITWLTPIMNSAVADRLQNTEVQVQRVWQVGNQSVSRRTVLNSAIDMEWQEPAFSGIDACLLTHRGWFPRPAETQAEIAQAARRGARGQRYVILPEPAARELGLSAELVDATNVAVTIRGVTFDVLGIFDPSALARIQGLDGRSLLPFDLNSVQQLGQRDGRLVVPEDVGRLAPSQVMIVNEMPPPKNEEIATVYCSILFPAAPYQLRADVPPQPAVDYTRQRRLVTDYLERLGQPAYYAVDGTSYYGSRQRARSLSGLLQLLVPLLIAALTVFNTMRGSVYERRGEIFVYNAVGIAPNHVFFMFMAEACVYAVVGAMCGYVLSQAMGRALTAAGLTGGLNLDYSSIETIYASLAIMAAVLLSTLLPARDAARLASPSGLTGWTLPKAEGDVMAFNLPFTFTPHDRVAVVAYFRRWLDANGAGSSGPFYCSPPEGGSKGDGKDGRLEGWKGGRLEEGKAGGVQGSPSSNPPIAHPSSLPVLPSSPLSSFPFPTPALRSTIWLKPYDLGVSQALEISLPPDPETGEFIAHIRLTRLSGHTAAWQRTVKPFLGALRKQFLNWRATTPADRTEMFAEARQFLGEPARKERPHG